MPKIYLASDHAGFALKQALVEYLITSGYETEDLGAYTLDPDDDYPDFVTPCAIRVAAEDDAIGIVIGGSGEGEAMCANRVRGVRAAVFYGQIRATAPLDVEGGHAEDGYDLVRLARRHNDANILSIGARFAAGKEAVEAVRIFLTTAFSGSPRHLRRINKF